MKIINPFSHIIHKNDLLCHFCCTQIITFDKFNLQLKADSGQQTEMVARFMRIEQISQMLTLRLSKYKSYEPKLASVYAYGIFMILTSTLLLLIALAVGFFSQSLPDIFLFLLFFVPLRLTSGGYHASTFLKCLLIYVLSLFSVIGLTNAIHFSYILPFILVANVLSILIIFLFAPVSHPNAPICSADQEKCKLLSRIISVSNLFMILLLYFVLHTNSWSASLLVAMSLGPLYASLLTLTGACMRRKEER